MAAGVGSASSATCLSFFAAALYRIAVRARAIWLEVVDGISPSATALMARLDALTDPELVEDANMLAGWRERYANEITERTKKRWWRRMLKRMRGKAEGSGPDSRNVRIKAA